MFERIKNRINRELAAFSRQIDRLYSLKKISPLLSEHIKEFILRDGKRIRPALFVFGYLGFARKKARGLYRSALAIELLHDFMLVHDDIIDKSDKRRNKPSMHKIFNTYLKRYKDIKFNGQDLSIVAGDVLYAMAIKTFLSIEEKLERKEKALQKFAEAALYTGAGEFIELINSAQSIERIKKEEICKIYDCKTARYTFAAPLSTGAILGGAPRLQVDKLFKFGIYLGRAFQIQDDILGIFGEEKKTGKPALSDLQEAKKTLLIWQAYNNSNSIVKSTIKKMLKKKKIGRPDLLKMRKIIKASGALAYAEKEITLLTRQAQKQLLSSAMREKYKTLLLRWPEKLFNVTP